MKISLHSSEPDKLTSVIFVQRDKYIIVDIKNTAKVKLLFIFLV